MFRILAAVWERKLGKWEVNYYASKTSDIVLIYLNWSL